MSEDQKIDGGIFIDTKTGDIVHEQPEEGIQIVPPGGVLDATAKARLDAEAGSGAGVPDVGVVPVKDDEKVDEKPAAKRGAKAEDK